jgi:uncharacterized membrane protein YfcA
LTPFDYASIAATMLAAGLIKGLIGFGLPLVAVSLLSSFLDVSLSLSLIILPIVFTNFWQGATGGRIKMALRRFWGLLITLSIGIWIGSRVVATVNPDAVLLILGCVVILYSLLELTAFRITIAPEHERSSGLAAGMVSGLVGGLTTSYGPFLAAYMSALKMTKDDFVGSAGVIWFWASLSLLVAYGSANILTAERALISAGCVIPALLGLHLGSLLRRRLNEVFFRRLLLFALIVTGLNLLRRGLM